MQEPDTTVTATSHAAPASMADSDIPDRDLIVSVREVDGGLQAFTPDALRAPDPSRADAPLRFKVRLADTEGRRSAASYLIRKMYGWRGYAASGPQVGANRITLAASDDDRTLATISIGFDSPEGLLVEDLYRDRIDQLRGTGGRICEFTKLAIEKNEQSKDVLAMMFHIAYMYAFRINGCSDLIIEVNPRHVRFYERMLGFTQFGEERMCARVGAPAVLLWLRLAYAKEQIERYGGHRERAGQVRALYPYFFSPEEEDGIVGRLRAIG